MSRLPHILILCTGNSCRSHMAEGILQNALGASARVSSAGSDPSGYVHSMAIEVMREIGIDISSHTSEHMDTYLNQSNARIFLLATAHTGLLLLSIAFAQTEK